MAGSDNCVFAVLSDALGNDFRLIEFLNGGYDEIAPPIDP